MQEEPTVAAPQREPPKLVPLQALQEARWEHRQFKEQTAQQIADLNRRLAVADELRAQIEGLRQPQVPKFDEDPLGNVSQRLAQTEQEAQMLKQYIQQRHYAEQEVMQRQQAISQLSNQVASIEQEYHKVVPDYFDAVTYLEQRERDRISATGVPQQNINQYIVQKKMEFISAAIQSGQNPADVAYRMAVADGWRRQAGQPAQQASLETLAQGQRAARTLSGTGKTEPANPSVEALLKLEGDEFDRAWEKLFGKR